MRRGSGKGHVRTPGEEKDEEGINRRSRRTAICRGEDYAARNKVRAACAGTVVGHGWTDGMQLFLITLQTAGLQRAVSGCSNGDAEGKITTRPSGDGMRAATANGLARISRNIRSSTIRIKRISAEWYDGARYRDKGATHGVAEGLQPGGALHPAVEVI